MLSYSAEAAIGRRAAYLAVPHGAVSYKEDRETKQGDPDFLRLRDAAASPKEEKPGSILLRALFRGREEFQ